MKKFNVGIQLYGLKNTLAKDFEGTIAKVAEMGYEYVEFAGYYDKSAEEILAVLEKNGLKCISVHQRLDWFFDDPIGKINYLKTFGVKYVVVPYHSKELLAGTPAWGDTVRLFNEYAKLFSEHGMVLGYHNHDFEYQTYEGKYLLDYIIESVPAGLIVPELDTCWVNYGGASVTGQIAKYAGMLPIIHLKDFTCTKRGEAVYELIAQDGSVSGKRSKAEDGFEYRPLGSGIQDFAAILSAAEASGTDTVIVEQDSVYGDMTELEAAKLSRDYLKETFGI
jgi:sugar phosphate isomerase/epimerase